ncbi:MAG: hypothetical protein JXA93_12145 [Anaerolineae bacterium]|nr:hypothetical protein [Anaerolineae bacterium]
MARYAAMILVLIWALACAGCTPTPDLEAGTSALPGSATTYYVRPDGGSTEQCTGQADAPYPGSGTGQPCAWDHPFRALPPGDAPRLSGGDTLLIAAGSYRMGYGAPGADGCDPDAAFECHVPPLPAGPDPAHPTRLLGKGWDTGCPAPPELWGAERPWYILNLEGSDNVEIVCLEITDHSGCVEFHTGGLACERDQAPYGDWAPIGLYAVDAENVTLRDLDVHGLAHTGILAGRLMDWTVENVRIAANGWVGWDGDVEGDDSNVGTLTFRHWIVEWNGCGETYPGGEPAGCWAQEAGGYGDGVGTGATGGDWFIGESAFAHNTSDGLDLLYHSEGGRVVLDRVRAEGNAGNQVKITGQASITNSVLVGNCGFFDGQPFTYHVDSCRALGNTLHLAFTGGEQTTLVNSTLYGQGDGLVGAGPREGFTCDGSERITAWNNVFLGDVDYFDPGDVTFLFYQEECAGLTLDSDYNALYQVKNVECGASGEYVNSGTHDLCQDPLLTGPLAGMAYGLELTAASPAIDAGTADGAPTVDFWGMIRDAVPDIGAYEWQSATIAVFLPLTATSMAPAGPRPPQIAGCDVLPADNVWNTPVDDLPLDANSDAYVATIGAGAHAHADFGSGEWPLGSGSPIGIPFVDVPSAQPRVQVTFDYDDESDPGPYPVPPDAPIEGGPQSDGDRHVLALDRDACFLYELYYAWPQQDGSWHAGSGAIFDLGSHALRPAGWTSADAAGLPILPGLVRYDEVASGEIRHALRFTAPHTRRAYVWPARHYASELTGSEYPPMGQRFRLKAGFDTSGFSPEVQVILQALKTYGMFLADNGSAWYLSGVPDERWDNDTLHELHQVSGSAFEAVDASSLMVDPDSGQVRRPAD